MPRASRDRRVALTLLCLLLLALAALLAVETPSAPTAGVRSAPRIAGTSTRAQARSRGVDLEQATTVARRFLRGYLSVVYGHGLARAVPDAAPSLAATIAERRRVPPGLARLHPRIVAVTAASAEAADTVVTATIGDGEVLNYRLRLLVAQTRGGRMVVAKVGEG